MKPAPLLLLLLALGACSAPARDEPPSAVATDSLGRHRAHEQAAPAQAPTPCVTVAGGAVVIAQNGATCR